MDYEQLDSKKPVRIREGVTEAVHVFDDDSRMAIKSALAAGRPLLVRGEPGVGKTQLAAAAAKVLARPLVSYVVNARTEASDLLWHFDAVRRLADAQLCGGLGLDAAEVEARLDLARYVTPGPLWWGFDWGNASERLAATSREPRRVETGADPANGRVVLIDEIDKADSDVPNGLLEALGAGAFDTHDGSRVEMGEPPPLVVVTTNEERLLPDAFIRRCLVLKLSLPEGRDQLKSYLLARSKAHFGDLDAALHDEAADLLIEDRAKVRTPPRPGLAEFLDLLRAVKRLEAEGVGSARQLLQSVARFTVAKHTE